MSYVEFTGVKKKYSVGEIEIDALRGRCGFSG